MPVFNYKQRNNIVLIILIILGCFILYSLRFIAGSLLSTVVTYTILRPLYIHLTEEWRWSKTVACISLMLSSFLVIVLPFFILSLMVINKIAEFERDQIKLKVMVARIDDFLGAKLHQPDLLENGIERATTYISDLFPSIIGGAFSLVLGIAIMYFLLYFMFIHHEKFEAEAIKYSPFREQNALRFGEELKNTTYSNVLGQGLIAVVQGALVSIGFFMFGIRDAIFWGVISTFLSFMPVLGAPIVFVPAALIELANGDTTAGYGILIWGFVLVINIDNVIRFLIAKRVGNIHPIITVVGVIIGIPVFGIMGLVFGPLLLSYFILTVRIYETSRLATEQLEKIRAGDEE
ncbi:AI-2E family transporter [Pedobacter sp. SYSU D00535]|uniref:AI-2E family transporter n=1 Tax=Pedobacter sp. SYSU D00535 TaxID=2810308 RepID=UPI001A9777A9|nr:AI-2E family transporter [Pedobacter sp. SYSU D00535]